MAAAGWARTAEEVDAARALAARLVTLRTSRGLSSSDLSRLLLTSRASIAAWEGAQLLPDPAMLDDYARELGASGWELAALRQAVLDARPRSSPVGSFDAFAETDDLVEGVTGVSLNNLFAALVTAAVVVVVGFGALELLLHLAGQSHQSR